MSETYIHIPTMTLCYKDNGLLFSLEEELNFFHDIVAKADNHIRVKDLFNNPSNTGLFYYINKDALKLFKTYFLETSILRKKLEGLLTTPACFTIIVAVIEYLSTNGGRSLQSAASNNKNSFYMAYHFLNKRISYVNNNTRLSEILISDLSITPERLEIIEVMMHWFDIPCGTKYHSEWLDIYNNHQARYGQMNKGYLVGIVNTTDYGTYLKWLNYEEI